MDIGNMLVEKSKLKTLINTFIADHSSTECGKSIQIKIVNLQPWGPFISDKVMCTVCSKKSDY